MRLVRLKLRSSQFWNLPPIRLSEERKLSPLLDIDKLNTRQKEVIDKSIKAKEISLVCADGTLIQGALDAANIIEGDYIETEDDDKPNLMPEIISVTVSEEEGESVPEEPLMPTEETLEEARILLNRNGNTVRKMIMALEKTSKDLAFLHACLEMETKGKKRTGVLQTIQQVILEH